MLEDLLCCLEQILFFESLARKKSNNNKEKICRLNTYKRSCSLDL